MKQRVLLLVATFLTTSGLAQPILFGGGDKPVKFSDVVEAYEKKSEVAERSAAKVPNLKAKDLDEDDNYHFERWKWYWQQHTDENGYLVSPVKNYEEWLKYGSKSSAAKSTAVNNSNWSFQGPSRSAGGYEGIGRINSIKFHPTDINTYWVCAPGGGLWKTVDDGLNWTCLTDGSAVIGCADLEVNPLNPETMYLCTGDRDGIDTYSLGILKSTDGGKTWNTTGMVYTASQTKLTNCLVINRVDTNSLTLAASDGIYKSYNGGATWILTQSGNFKQVLYHPTDTNVLYATKYDPPAAVLRSDNGGATWTQVFSSSSVQRITAAVTPAAINVVKFIAANTSNNGLEGIYNSTDTGKTFTKIFSDASCSQNIMSNDPHGNTCGGQGWYDLAFAISPINSNMVIMGGINSWYSTNGGASWTLASQWSTFISGVTVVHADKHCQAFQPTRPSMLFEGNDGGIYKCSSIAGGLWNDMTNGLGITQFYRNAVANNTTYALGGAQDNGTKQLQGGLTNFVGYGDGMNCEIDYADSNTYYTSWQNGSIDRKSIALGSVNISSKIPGSPTGPWITSYIISPFNHLHLFAGYKQVYFSSDAGNNWVSLTPTPLNSGKYVKRLAMTPANDSALYVVLESSNTVYYAYDFYPGNIPTFSSVTAPVSGNISDIKVDPKNKNHFWISFSGYSATTKVYEYNAGTWTAVSTGLPNVPANCLEVDSSDGTLYAGTDIGVYYYDTAAPAQWKSFSTNLPAVDVTDMGINYTHNEIWAATYGRGMWKSYKLGFIPPPDAPVDTIKNITDTSADILWNIVSGGVSYEYSVSTSALPPSSGAPAGGTFYHAGQLSPGTKYYVHLRTIGSIKNSAWVTTNFTTTTVSVESFTNNRGFAVYPNPVTNVVTVKVPIPYTGKGLLTVTDLGGKIVANTSVSGNSFQFDMSNCAAGNYILKYSNGVYSQSVKISRQ